MTERETLVLRTLNADGPLTVDQFVTARGWYVNSWAPTFTGLRKKGLIARTGEMRATSHGSKAHVLRITRQGRELLAEERAVAAA